MDMTQAVPDQPRKGRGRLADALDSWIVDHCVFRTFVNTRVEIAPGVWRSGQPLPYQIRGMARDGIRTIVNLRGPRDCGSYRREAEACRRHGITLIDIATKSRDAPKLSVLRQIRQALETAEHPILFHCKSGSDRAGLMAALYLITRGNRPAAEALKQLHWRYLHFKKSPTGVLDRFIEAYAEANAREPIGFWDWVEQGYDRKAVKASFTPSGIATIIVDGLLGRE
ncbi:fused DSP-PTPase phosphatase/NAD kinase-like protein [Inquilinus limosus]|uniref:fused DSP-PTPase phosphatase/NAD kinase-like protein n=1 Tax=Inquilinus limosus TaxID=171674 RepID=UPI0004126214|nr:sulfur transferase domain-containing protein [Inquilinus limosus]